MDGTGVAPHGRVVELVGVYDADGSVWGEIRYVLGRLRGTAHCSLCDTTHSGWRRRASWDQMVARLGVPFRLVHLDERDAETEQVSGTAVPCVLARIEPTDAVARGDLVVLVGPAALATVAGDPDALERLLLDLAASRELLLARS